MITEDILISKKDLMKWLDREITEDDEELCLYLSNAVKNQYEYHKEIERLNNIIEKQGIKDAPDYYVKGSVGSIKERDEEIERLSKEVTKYDEILCERNNEVDRLYNIINEIEEMLSNPYNVDCVNQNTEFLNRIKELKEGK